MAGLVDREVTGGSRTAGVFRRYALRFAHDFLARGMLPLTNELYRKFLDSIEMPAVCGLVCYPLVSANGQRPLQGHFGPSVSAGKIPFPGNGDRCGRRLVRMLGIARGTARKLWAVGN